MTEALLERSRRIRRTGGGLISLIHGRPHPIIELSPDGLSFQGSGFAVGKEVPVTLARLTQMSDCTEGWVRIVSSSDGVTRGAFKPSVPLLRYVIGHMSETSGTKPTYFKP